MSAQTAITNQEFAERVGCHHTMASRLLNGQRLASLELLNRIADEFGIPLADLITARLAGSDELGKTLRSRVDQASA